VRDSSFRSEFNLVQRNDSLCVYRIMRVNFSWRILKTGEVLVMKSFSVDGYGELDWVV